MTTAINIYATSVTVIHDGSEGIAMTIGGIDPSQVAQEFSMDELLDIYDVSDINTYLTKRIEDERL
jgi:hypothetical protein